ncbi:MAG: hypothetical protein EBQ92_00750 [Proteobacteria bacterium]|nr:hypothetical protein [Pseudomonadota bacterium]
MSKDDFLNNLISKTPNAKNTKEKYVINSQIVDNITKKFNELRNSESILPNNVTVGQAIRYVDKKLSKLSIVGIVMHIDYYSETKCSDVKTFYLYNSYVQQSWRINPEKYYIFQHRKIKLSDKIMAQIIDEYKDIIEKNKKKQ